MRIIKNITLYILIYLPLVSLSQISSINTDDYIPGFITEGNKLDISPEAKDFLPFTSLGYTALADSFYGYTNSGFGGAMTLFGSFTKSPPPCDSLYSHVYINSVLANSDIHITIDPNTCHPTVLNSVMSFGPTTNIDSMFYSPTWELLRVVNREISSFGSYYYEMKFIYSGSNITEIQHFDLPNQITPSQIDLITYNTSNFVNTITTSNNMFEYYYDINNLPMYALYYNNGVFIDTVGKWIFNGNLLSEYHNTIYNMSDQSIEEGPLKSIIGHDSYDRLISQTDYELDNGAWVLTSNIDYVYYSTPSSVINIKENKKLIKIFDILARETKEKKNTPLFYIYDDGTVEKKITTNKTY